MGALALLGVALRLAAPARPAPDPEAVASLLGEASGSEVSREDYVWERSRGWLIDALVGRRVIFLGAAPSEPRDLHRAIVRVTREGHPFEVAALHRLTDTPLGDETDLVAAGQRVAFATRHDGAVQGVTVLELSGPRTDDLGLLDRLGILFGGWLDSGSPAGLGRVELAFRRPPPEVDLQLLDGELRMAVGAADRPAVLQLGELRLDSGGDRSLAAEAWRQRPEARALDQLTGELGSWWAEVRGHRVDSPREEAADLPPIPEGRGWPPPAPEGSSWTAFAPTGADDPPLLAAEVSRQGQRVVLVAIDTRRLDLGFRAGRRHPQALTGPHGSGRLPTGLAPRVVGAFNGGDDRGGAVDGGRVLVPPRSGEATVGVDRHGRLRLGRLEGHRPPSDLTALRQSASPLVEGGRRPERPGGRIPRTALGRTSDGFAIHAFSDGATAQTMAEALRAAGCVFAVPLRIGSGPLGLAAWPAGEPAKARRPIATMSFEAEAVIAGSQQDFFYLVAREPHPRLGNLDWRPAPGRQPEPQSWPAIHLAKTESLGVEVTVHHVAPGRLSWEIRPGRKESAAETTVQELSEETRRRALLAIGLGLAHRKDNLRGLVLDGVQTLPIRPFVGAVEAREGDDLVITYTLEDMAPEGDATELPLLAEGGKTRRRTKKLGARRRRAAACTAEDGSLLVASATYDTSEPVAQTLLELGCERIVELDRGRQVRSFVYHAGAPLSGEEPPEPSDEDEANQPEPGVPSERRLAPQYLETVIYGLEAEARGRARPL